jgi:Calcineurin-like phosphoesterase/Purple acid Phosphatase, N-terminal domain
VLTPYGEVPEHLADRLSMADLDELLRRPVRRRTLLQSALVAGAAGPLLWAPPPPATLVPRGARRLSFGADPTSQMSLTFSINGSFRNAAVEYGANRHFGSTQQADVRAVRAAKRRYGRVRLDGLQPDTEYAYRIRVDGKAGRPGSFRTAPDGSAPFRFTAFADQGVSQAARDAVSRVGGLDPAFHLVAGDLCYAKVSGLGQPGGVFVPEIWDSWFRIVEPVAEKVPWMVAAGNHEMEPGYGKLGYDGMVNRITFPSNGAPGCPSTYSFRYGDVGFVALDSNDVSYEIPANFGYSHGAQELWLERTLSAMRRPGSGVDIIVVFFHHCPYATGTAHGSEGGIREKWVHLFDRYEVDLAITGHNHCYERTAPIRHGVVVDTDTKEIESSLGTTYVTVGGGGRDLNRGYLGGGHRTRVSIEPHRNVVETANWSLPSRTATHSFLVVDVQPASRPGGQTTLTMVMLATEDARELDRWTLHRRTSRAANTMVPLPRTPPASVTSDGSGADSSALWVVGGGAAALAVGAAGYGAMQYRRRASG